MLGNIGQIIELCWLFIVSIGVIYQTIKWVVPLTKKGLLIKLLNEVADAYKLTDVDDPDKLKIVLQSMNKFCEENHIKFSERKMTAYIEFVCAIAKLIKNKLNASKEK